MGTPKKITPSEDVRQTPGAVYRRGDYLYSDDPAGMQTTRTSANPPVPEPTPVPEEPPAVLVAGTPPGSSPCL